MRRPAASYAVIHFGWPLKSAWMSRDAQERVDGLPRKPHADCAVELLGDPRCGLLVLLGTLVNGLQYLSCLLRPRARARSPPR